MQNLITNHLDIWTSAHKTRSTAGRGSSNKLDLYGIKKLRELILELAVRGKLVPQNANDEPASELLKRIAAEKTKLIKEGRIKKEKPLPEITDEEKPFELPSGWEWTKFYKLPYSYSVGLDRGKNEQGNDKAFRYFRMNNILNSGGFSLADIVRVDASEDEVMQFSLSDGDFLFNTRNSRELVGKTCVFKTQDNEPILYNNNILRAKFTSSLIASLTDLWMRSIQGQYELEQIKSGTTNVWAIYQGKLEELVCPIPPLAEQHRIVTKVDELMAFCDQLEQTQSDNIAAHAQLVEALLATLTNSSDHNELQTNWQRIAAHFDTLFTTEHSIDQLKQTILQLAVMGKLVPQNPNDEPASELLKKITAEKAQLIKEGKIKKEKPLPEITDEEKPFELPSGWEFSRLQECFDVRDGTHDSPKEAIGENTFPLVTSKDFHDGNINFDSAKRISEYDHIEISKRSLVAVDDILFSMIGGNIGNQVIVKDNRPFSIKNVALFKYYNKIYTVPKYFKIYTEHLAFSLQNEASGGAQPFVALGSLRKLIFALPPLAEQHRIVAKVDELMALCDTLKANLQNAQTTQLALADALVEQAVG